MYKENDLLKMNVQTEYQKAKEMNRIMSLSNMPYGLEDPVAEDVNVKTEEVSGKVVSTETGEISRPYLVLPIAGEPTNGTIFPKEEKFVWEEIKRVIDKMVENMANKGNFRLLIPIWNKYDLEFLRSAEKHNVPVTFVLPTQSWGEVQLPKFQTDLVIRMKSRKHNKVVVHRGKNIVERVEQSIKVADLIIGLDNGVNMQQFYNTINNSNAVAKPFPLDKMNFTSEEEAKTIQAKTAQASTSNMSAEDMLPGL